eukprot:CAMPEP_0173405846 /NCGR_PEP_ID=MMETSP1356-20130122/62929_1 /TAXON_ID=77927 ORGANISM="Hemiselmis virescens, Strain PCC157" /NCGR_SAMPLE_ID=MMETSP1356 /ASSEMBLY_ACC=CAM_ASM_000847 /LENGTH=51 /DNA_ID=CAMNT_0014366711 /DNA_START=94 /DNA_END=246 /DNA_ORIENTATION=+
MAQTASVEALLRKFEEVIDVVEEASPIKMGKYVPAADHEDCLTVPELLRRF